ncbi:FimV/HubP family polar landmark protein [Thiohalorhabdus methylotrophus]|uniref:FimV/HubP family polar landmark protein n=1 Tax=Thiohalorhabdus methylotrophus TaxID=3242694 RepID=A0ABV4TW96_9GAMM
MPKSAHPGRLRNPSRARPTSSAKAGSAAVVFGGFMAVSPATMALGLGDLQVESKLGSPLHAEAPIHLSGGESGSPLEATLAAPADYEMVGKSPSPVVNQIQVRLVGDASPRIVISSSRPVTDPLFEVMIRVGDGDNQVLKMYTVALDPAKATPPPSAANSRSAEAEPSRARQAQDRRTNSATSGGGSVPRKVGPAVERPKVAVTEGWSKRNRYGPVREGDTLATIVQRVRRDPSVPEESAVVAVWKENPEAFIDNNMNLLRRGAVLEMPEEQRIRRIPVAEAQKTILEQRREWTARGRPQVKTNPGHERYRLKVALDQSEKGKQAEDGPETAEQQGESGARTAAAASDKADAGNPVSGASGEKPDLKEAAAAAGQAIAEGKGEEPSGLKVAKEVQASLESMRETLDARRSTMKATVQSLENRITSLNDQVDQQKSLIAKQSEAMSRIATGSNNGSGGMPGRDRYVLWMLAGINLLMLLAILALWRRIRGTETTPAPAGGGGETPQPAADTAELDPLSEANAQVASGELKQARSTLWEALAVDPRNWALYGRLLDLYEQEGDADQFEEVARRLFAQLGGEHREWQEEVRGRGRQLKPESTLFAALGDQPGDGSDVPTFDMDDFDLGVTEETDPEEAAADPGREAAEQDEGEGAFDFDLEADSGAAGAAEADAPEGVAALEEDTTGSAPESEEDLTFSLDEESTEPTAEEAEADDEPAASTAEEDDDLELDLSLDAEATGDSGETTPEMPAPNGESEKDSPESFPDESSEGGQFSADEPEGDLEFDLSLSDTEEPEAGTGESESESDAIASENDFSMAEGLEWPGTEEEEPSTPETPDTPGPEEAEDGGELDLELPEPEGETGYELFTESEGPEDSSGTGEPRSAFGDEAGTAEEDDGELDLSLSEEDLDLGGSDTWGENDSWTELDTDPEDAASEGLGGNGQDEDEFEIKLDLAQAWIDMGDQESAKGLLQEVEARGGSGQQERARKLLATLA